MKKRLLAIIATAAMIVTMIPAMVFADGANVAKIASTGAEYATLQEAVNEAKDSDIITIIRDIEQQDGVLVTNKNITIDLNDKIFTVTEGASTNNRNFKIDGDSVVTIKNGTMIAKGDYSSGAYGTVRTEGTAKVMLTDLKLYNYRGNGLNIKACGGTTVIISDTEIYSQYGGGIESAGGTIELTNVKVEQKGMYTAPYNSMAISVNGGGTVTVNSGTYSTECITAEEANGQGTSHGPWVVGVLNSGGKLIINGGTFSNDNFGENSLATAARGAVLADTGAVIEINGGTFNALKSIIDIQNNLGDASKNPTGTISGGTFSVDPTNDYIKLSEGYKFEDGEVICTHDDIKTESKDPTCTEDGYKDAGICKYCGEIVEPGEVIKATGHTYEDGKCTVCGENEPAPTPDQSQTESDPAEKPDTEESEDAVDTGDNMNMTVPFAIAGLALAAMTAVVATRRREN